MGGSRGLLTREAAARASTAPKSGSAQKKPKKVFKYADEEQDEEEELSERGDGSGGGGDEEGTEVDERDGQSEEDSEQEGETVELGDAGSDEDIEEGDAEGADAEEGAEEEQPPAPANNRLDVPAHLHRPSPGSDSAMPPKQRPKRKRNYIDNSDDDDSIGALVVAQKPRQSRHKAHSVPKRRKTSLVTLEMAAVAAAAADENARDNIAVVAAAAAAAAADENARGNIAVLAAAAAAPADENARENIIEMDTERLSVQKLRLAALETKFKYWTNPVAQEAAAAVVAPLVDNGSAAVYRNLPAYKMERQYSETVFVQVFVQEWNINPLIPDTRAYANREGCKADFTIQFPDGTCCGFQVKTCLTLSEHGSISFTADDGFAGYAGLGLVLSSAHLDEALVSPASLLADYPSDKSFTPLSDVNVSGSVANVMAINNAFPRVLPAAGDSTRTWACPVEAAMRGVAHLLATPAMGELIPRRAKAEADLAASSALQKEHRSRDFLTRSLQPFGVPAEDPILQMMKFDMTHRLGGSLYASQLKSLSPKYVIDETELRMKSRFHTGEDNAGWYDLGLLNPDVYALPVLSNDNTMHLANLVIPATSAAVLGLIQGVGGLGGLPVPIHMNRAVCLFKKKPRKSVTGREVAALRLDMFLLPVIPADSADSGWLREEYSCRLRDSGFRVYARIGELMRLIHQHAGDRVYELPSHLAGLTAAAMQAAFDEELLAVAQLTFPDSADPKSAFLAAAAASTAARTAALGDAEGCDFKQDLRVLYEHARAVHSNVGVKSVIAAAAIPPPPPPCGKCTACLNPQHKQTCTEIVGRVIHTRSKDDPLAALPVWAPEGRAVCERVFEPVAEMVVEAGVVSDVGRILIWAPRKKHTATQQFLRVLIEDSTIREAIAAGGRTNEPIRIVRHLMGRVMQVMGPRLAVKAREKAPKEGKELTEAEIQSVKDAFYVTVESKASGAVNRVYKKLQ